MAIGKTTLLAILLRALRTHGAPDTLYLDNGSTCRGEALGVRAVRWMRQEDRGQASA